MLRAALALALHVALAPSVLARHLFMDPSHAMRYVITRGTKVSSGYLRTVVSLRDPQCVGALLRPDDGGAVFTLCRDAPDSGVVLDAVLWHDANIDASRMLDQFRDLRRWIEQTLPGELDDDGVGAGLTDATELGLWHLAAYDA